MIFTCLFKTGKHGYYGRTVVTIKQEKIDWYVSQKPSASNNPHIFSSLEGVDRAAAFHKYIPHTAL